MSLSNRETGLLMILVLVGSIFLLSQFLYQPLTYQQQCQQTINERLRRELDGMEARIYQIGDQAQEELESVEEYEQMLAEIPPGPMIPEVIDFLEMSAQEAQVKLLSIYYQEGAVPQDLVNTDKSSEISLDIQPINFKIAARGNHYNLLALVLRIENASRLFIINGIKLTKTKTEWPSAEASGSGSSIEDNNSPDSPHESQAPESVLFDPSLSSMEIDFTAFYECPP